MANYRALLFTRRLWVERLMSEVRDANLAVREANPCDLAVNLTIDSTVTGVFKILFLSFGRFMNFRVP